MREGQSAPETTEANGRLGRIFARVYREREIILRSGGRVRFLRLTPRLQVFLTIVLICIFGWGAGGTYVSWLEYDLIRERDNRLAEAKIAYDDLLEEIAIYQRKVANVTGKLRENQSNLVRQFAVADALEAEVRATEDTAPSKTRQLAAITEARSAMHLHLEQLQSDLRAMTDWDTALKTSLNSMQSDLLDALAERKKGYQARAILVGEVKELKEALRESQEYVAALRLEREALDGSLSQSRAEMDAAAAAHVRLKALLAKQNRDLEMAANEKAAFEAQVAEVREELGVARKNYDRIAEVRAELDVKVAALHGALRAEEDRGNALEADLQKFSVRLSQEVGEEATHNPAKETLSTRVASLLNRLTSLHQARAHVMDTLHTRTANSVEEAERILSMTGLDVDKLLTQVSATHTLGEGGPFIAALPDGAEITGFAGKVSGLDNQLIRLEALQSALRAVPLVAPLDGYRIASSYGKRKDPITKNWAMHSGVDLSAPFKTAVRASAPGVVTIANWNGRYGRMVEIDHGFGIRTRYGHLRKILVKKGQRISHRDKIALLGSSGRSTGPHLHYEILYGKIAMNPMRFIKAGQYVFKE